MSDKILYLECAAGISGDMSVAALLDLGASEEVLKQVLGTVPLEGFDIKISKVKKSSIECLDFDVILDEELDNHDHDMEYLHGDGGEHSHDRHHEHSHSHSHDDDHNHSHTHNHHHVHRGLNEVNEIIDATQMTDGARALAKKIFLNLGKAEAKAHGRDLSQVHFHEVGAVDSIVDTVGCA